MVSKKKLMFCTRADEYMLYSHGKENSETQKEFVQATIFPYDPSNLNKNYC